MVQFKRKKPAATGRRQPATPVSEQRKVFSYHSSRVSPANREEPQRKHTSTSLSSGKKKRALSGSEWLRNLPSFVALVAVVLSVLFCLGLTTNAKVNFVGTADEESLTLRSKEEYQAGAEDILSGSILNRTKFTINTKGFEEDFKQQFPEVADVALTLPLVSRRPIVNISTGQPALLLVSQGQSYVLDKRGVVIMKSESLPEPTRATLTTVQDQSGVPVEVGKGALSAQDISFITEVVAQLKAKNVIVETVILPPRAHQVDMRIQGVPYTVKFSVDTEAREAAGTFLATKAKLEKDKITPAEYIDVRVDGRAYYK